MGRPIQVPDLILFDLDGTLADTAPDLIAAANEVTIEFGGKPGSASDLRPLVGQGGRALLNATLGPVSTDVEARRVARFLARYAARICVATRLFDGMPTLLSSLRESGCHWGIVSNKPHPMCESVVAGLRDRGQLDRPLVTIGAGATRAAKPDPAGLLLAASCAGAAPQRCWYVGDDERDIVAARRAGMTAIAAAWGYIPPGTSPAAWEADFIADSPAHLHAVFEAAAPPPLSSGADSQVAGARSLYTSTTRPATLRDHDESTR
ncbi:MAG: HAD-IA family hydrolase [Pseudomonadota bacterium]